MKAVTRRVYEMCARVLVWIGAHADDEPGMVVLVARLEVLVARMTQVVNDQRGGRIDSRAASARKQELRREDAGGGHRPPGPDRVAGGAGGARAPDHVRVQAHGRHAAGLPGGGAGMFAAAQEHKEVLVKHGLSESVLVQFGKSLDAFDAAVTLGGTGRTLHTAATRELDALTKEAPRSSGRWMRGTGSGSRTTGRRWSSGSARARCWGSRDRPARTMLWHRRRCRCRSMAKRRVGRRQRAAM